ncbi:hypothetical protein [Microbulbifer spongiae]|nr:hypothetical protein [Microbulbifer sp. MI-G]
MGKNTAVGYAKRQGVIELLTEPLILWRGEGGPENGLYRSEVL